LPPWRIAQIEQRALAKLDSYVVDQLERHRSRAPRPDIARIAALLPVEGREAEVANVLAHKQVSAHPAEPGEGTAPTSALVETHDAPVKLNRSDKTSTDSGESVDPSNLRELLRSAARKMTSAEDFVLRKRFGLDGEPPLSVNEIAYLYRYAEDRVQTLEQRALAKLPSSLAAAIDKLIG
jgi:DNA-directed RNA polymerase specialized sigma subunit